MIIDNIFSIKTYLGSQPLPLFDAPTALANNTTYTTFLNNVITIYGTQNNNGVIPFFYKTSNTPNPQSSLRFLEPFASYYFISRSDSTFPYNIPVSGQLVPTPYRNCPSIDMSTLNVLLTAASGNYYYLNQDITNLNKGLSYIYNIKNIYSNWKITTIPSSGIISSSKDVNNIVSVIRFDNDANVSDYSTFLPPGTDEQQIDKKNLFGIIEVSVISPTEIDCPKIIDIITVRCDNCIPLPSPTPTPTSTATPTPTPTLTATVTPSVTPPPLFNSTLNSPSTADGITFTASTGDTFRYTSISPRTGSPNTMNLRISGSAVSSVNFPGDYSGRPFRFTRASTGLSYNGSFQNGTVNLS